MPVPISRSLCRSLTAFGKDTKLIYRHYATLYFVFAVDNAESELGILDLIQVFVEVRDEAWVGVGTTARWASPTLQSNTTPPFPSSPPPLFARAQALDKCFENVCELDVIFHSDKVHYILDEVVMGGMVLETNLPEIMDAIIEMNKLEQATKAAGIRA